MISPLAPLDHAPRGLRPPYDQNDPTREQRFGVETTEQWRTRMHADKLAALTEPLADLPLGVYDQAVLDWMAGWDIPTVATLASLLHRARMSVQLNAAGGAS